VRRRDVRPQLLRALPGFENNETVLPVSRLERADGRGVDVTRIFDAPLFCVHIGDVGAKGGQKFSRRPGLAVMMATTRIIRYSLWLVGLL